MDTPIHSNSPFLCRSSTCTSAPPYPSHFKVTPPPPLPSKTFTPSLLPFPYVHSKETCAVTAKNIYGASLPPSLPSLPPDAITNSLLSPLTSFPLSSTSRIDPDFRFPNPTYRFLPHSQTSPPSFPLHPPPPTPSCRCGALLDPFGDHFFSCASTSKQALSNTLRNTLWALCHTTTTLADLTTTSTDVLLEPHNLAPSFPKARPADVGIRLLPLRPCYNTHFFPRN